MKAQDIMQSRVKTCGPDTNLHDVAQLMWDTDCGSLPVIDERRRPIGMITDRDIAMGSTFQNRPLSELRVREVTNGRAVYTAQVSDDVKTIMDTMRKNKVRRVPIVDSSGALQGIITLDDLVVLAEKTPKIGADKISYDDVLLTLKALSHAQASSKAA